MTPGEQSSIRESAIELIMPDRGPHYKLSGWQHWPRPGLGETQEGGGSVSEVVMAGSRMIPGDLESWHAEWMPIAARNLQRGLADEKLGHRDELLSARCGLLPASCFQSHRSPAATHVRKMKSYSHKMISKTSSNPLV